MMRFFFRKAVTCLALLALYSTGCSSDVGIQLRDAAVSATATFVEQQTLALLSALFPNGETQ